MRPILTRVSQVCMLAHSVKAQKYTLLCLVPYSEVDVSEFLIISTSLNPKSKSRILCQTVFEHLQKKGTAEFVDLRDLDLPMCDAGACYGHPSVGPIAEKIKNAKCVVLGTPVYNYAACAAAKNLIELTGRAWTDKLVGFVCAAGGRMSYMSVMGIANSLMLDFRCLIIPRFVYAEGSGFDESGKPLAEIDQRIEELANTANSLTSSLSAK